MRFCSECGEICARQSILVEHQKLMHNYLFEKAFKCNHCPSSFNKKVGLDRHVKRDHDPNNPRSERVAKLACDSCGKMFLYESTLRKHKKHLHNITVEVAEKIKVGNFKCEHCEKTFSNKGNMVRHMRTDHVGAGNVSKVVSPGKFPCDKCGKSFSNKGNLNKHVKIAHDKLK